MDTVDLRTAPPSAAGRAGAPGTSAAPRTTAAARSAARRAPRPVPERDATYEHLGLDALRAYRTALQDEESKVSYWRRILQARLDVVRAGTAPSGALPAETLRPVLADARVGSGRSALVQVLPVDDIPPLPSLAELWDRRVGADDVAGQDALEADLSVAEEQLSAYRNALHGRLARATDELIARYREQPLLCLVALPGQVPAPRSGREPRGSAPPR